MAEFIDNYIRASGAKSSVRTEFHSLISRIPSLSSNPLDAAIQVKEALYNAGFSYDADSYLVQDVLKRKAGNCLGLPLLVGAVMGEFGFTPKYQLVVNPQDEVSKLERTFYERLQQDMSYDVPELAARQEDFPIYRFVPLEHLVLDTNGKFFLETTSHEHKPIGYESAVPLTFNQALSCVCKDQAIDLDNTGEDNRAIQAARQGLKLWGDNCEIYAFLAQKANEQGNRRRFEENLGKFRETRRKGSLFDFDEFLFTGDTNHLDAALNAYPVYAQAVANKASTLAISDFREAKFLFAVASHLYANSSSLDLLDFYATHKLNLERLFGSSEIGEVINRLVA